jgi:membrane protein implicated in regulation of membrane protease activity
MEIVSGIAAWLDGLDPNFAFLLALPFAVAALGLLADWRDNRSERRRRHVQRLRRTTGGVAHVR